MRSRKPYVHLLLLGALLASTSSGCNCGSHIHAVEPDAMLATPIDFGGVPVGQTGRQRIKVTNEGAGLLTLLSFTVSPSLFGGPEVVDGGPALATFQVGAGETSALEVTYTPTAVGTAASPDTGTLTATTDDPTHRTVTVTFTGYGTQAAFTVAPAALAFGDVQRTPGTALTPPTQTVTVTNIGSATSNITAVSLSSDDAGAFTTSPPLDQLAGPLAPGAALTVTVAFAPTDLTAHAGTLAFLTDYSGQPELDVALSGRGVESLWQLCRQLFFDDGGSDEALCIPTPPDSVDGGNVVSINFGARDEDGPPAHARIWAQNAGNQALTINAIQLDIPQIDPCPGGPYPSSLAFASTSPAGFIDGGTFGVATLDAGQLASMDVTYTAQHHCATGSYLDGETAANDDIDVTAQVLVGRTPLDGTRTLVCILEGHSALPAIEGQSFDITGGTSGDAGVAVIVQNGGEKELTISTAEVVDSTGLPCTQSAAPECHVIAFASAPLPLEVPPVSAATPDGGRAFGSAQLGLLTAFPDAGTANAGLQLTTDDPHHPIETFPIVLRP